MIQDPITFQNVQVLYKIKKQNTSSKNNSKLLYLTNLRREKFEYVRKQFGRNFAENSSLYSLQLWTYFTFIIKINIIDNII